MDAVWGGDPYFSTGTESTQAQSTGQIGVYTSATGGLFYSKIIFYKRGLK
jgi:hypothetical protein